ncbi:Abi family protein [Variovorax boronicumulans]|uniref:Abi family protein n=1 Tax=Variovorax boronicumulans TaxID=436515 RepID=UPI001C5669C3
MLDYNNMSAQNVQEVIQAISHVRLGSYRRFFQAGTDLEALGLYQWNEDLREAFARTTDLIEVVLRNKFHAALSQRYGQLGSAGSRDWYAHLRLPQKSFEKVRDITHVSNRGNWRPRQPARTPDDVVSNLTFGFWPRLLDVSTDTNQVAVPWNHIIPDVLPGHRQRVETYWRPQAHQDAFFARLDLCNDLRNRIAHLEPIWKLGPLREEARNRPGRQVNIVDGPTRTPQESLDRLRLIDDRLIELLHWLSPTLASLYRQCPTHSRCVALLTPAALDAYRQNRPFP